LLALLAAYLVFGPTLWPQFDVWWHWRDAALSALYVSDYGRAFWHMPHIVQHTWSLGVEEHFYLIWPPAVIGLLRLPPRWRLGALLTLYVAATAWRMAWYDEAADWPETYFRFDTRMSGLILGALLATLLGEVRRCRHGWPMCPAWSRAALCCWRSCSEAGTAKAPSNGR
jgi:peptidoglycan/LPS O-acetylase OafA/YrhL